MKKKLPYRETDTDKTEKAPENNFSHSMSLPTILIVIVNWNEKDVLLECLASIKKINYSKDKYKVLVIDNGSNDDSQNAALKFYPEIILLKNKRNIGYVKAVNQGIEYGLKSGVEYIWIFNNDVVVEENSLKKLVEVGEENEEIGVIAPVIYCYDDPEKIDNIGYSINFWTGRFKKLKYGQDVFKNHNERIADVDSILGCSNLIKTTVFKKVGLLRPLYELYFEETDFNIRVRRKNLRVVVVKEAKVLHKNASTMNKFIFRRAYLLLRNLFLFELFNAKPKHLFVFIPYYFLVHIPYFFLRGSIYGLGVKRMLFKRRYS